MVCIALLADVIELADCALVDGAGDTGSGVADRESLVASSTGVD